MNGLSDQFPVQRLAEVLAVSRMSVYRVTKPGPRAMENAILTDAIERVFKEHERRYGSPRICIQLQAEGRTCGENRVARLMREAGLRAISPRRKTPRTTDSSHDGPIAPNLLKSMEITHANQVWAMDITYVECGQGWVYLAAVLDLYLHKMVGWQLADHMESSLVTDALQMAAQRQNWPRGVVVHSDRGSQYASQSFIQLCEAFGYLRSMSAKGNCYDNATMESFFGVLKREELNRWEMPDLATVRYRVFDYIETYYNRHRLHTALGMGPAAFEKITLSKTPSAEFSEASIAPQVGHEKAGEMTPRPRPVVAISTHPSASCSPAEPASVSVDNQSIRHTDIENNNKKEYHTNR
jgi:transposase InsO family protein